MSMEDTANITEHKKLDEITGAAKEDSKQIRDNKNVFFENAEYGEASKVGSTQVKILAQGGTHEAAAVDISEASMKATEQKESIKSKVKEAAKAKGTTEDRAKEIANELLNGDLSSEDTSNTMTSSGVSGTVGAIASAQSGAKVRSDIASVATYSKSGEDLDDTAIEGFERSAAMIAIEKATKEKQKMDFAFDPTKTNRQLSHVEDRAMSTLFGKDKENWLEGFEDVGFKKADGTYATGMDYVRAKAKFDASAQDRLNQGNLGGISTLMSTDLATGFTKASYDGVEETKSGGKNEQNFQHLDGPVGSSMQTAISHVKLVGPPIAYGMGVVGNSTSSVAQGLGASEETGDDIGAVVASGMFMAGALYGGEKAGRWINNRNGKLASTKDFSWTDKEGKTHEFKAGEALDFDKHPDLEDHVKKNVNTRGADTFINKTWDKTWDKLKKGGEFIRESFSEKSDSKESFDKSTNTSNNTSNNDHSDKSENEKPADGGKHQKYAERSTDEVPQVPHDNSFDKDNKTSSNDDGASGDYTENNEKSQVKSEHSAKNKAQSLLDYAKKHPKKMGVVGAMATASSLYEASTLIDKTKEVASDIKEYFAGDDNEDTKDNSTSTPSSHSDDSNNSKTLSVEGYSNSFTPAVAIGAMGTIAMRGTPIGSIAGTLMGMSEAGDKIGGVMKQGKNAIASKLPDMKSFSKTVLKAGVPVGIAAYAADSITGHGVKRSCKPNSSNHTLLIFIHAARTESHPASYPCIT